MKKDYFIRGDNIDLRKVLGADSEGDEVNESWIGYNTEYLSNWVDIRLHDEYGSTQEVSRMNLQKNGDSVIAGQAAFMSNHGFATLRRKLRKLVKCTRAGYVSAGGLVFDWWTVFGGRVQAR